MADARVVDAADAAEMSREQALRVLATAEGIPEADRRMAQLMLAGPDIGLADQAVRTYGPRRKPLFVAVVVALNQLQQDHREAVADLRSLGGAHG